MRLFAVLACSLLTALPVQGWAALSSKCSSCHNVPSDNASAPLRPWIVNGAGSTAIINNAISSGLMGTITLVAGELEEIASFLQAEVSPIDGGRLSFNSTAPNKVNLGAGSRVYLKTAAPNLASLSNFDKLELVTDASKGTVTVAEETAGSGVWIATYSAKANEFGADSFTYRASGSVKSSERTVNITIDPPGAPTVETVTRTVALNSAGVDIAVSVTGGFKNTITKIGASSVMRWTDGKERGSGSLTLPVPLPAPVAGTTVVFRYVPPRDGFGSETFTYTAAAAGGNAADGQITIAVDPAPATVNAATLIVKLNTPTALDLKPYIGGSEISGVRIASQPAHGKAAINGTVLTYTPRRNYFGPDQFTWSAFGVLGESIMTSTVSVQVVGRPDPSQDPDVRGLVAAQTGAAQRFAWAQIDHLQRRLERLHRRAAGGNGSAASGGTPLDALPAMRSPVLQHEAARAAFESQPHQTARNAFARAPTDTAAGGGAAPHPLANNSPLSLIGELAQLVKSGALDLGGAARLGLLPGVGGAADADAGFWLAGRVSLGRRPAQSGQSALAIDSDSATLGFDRRLGSRLSLGLAFGATRERARIGSWAATTAPPASRSRCTAA